MNCLGRSSSLQCAVFFLFCFIGIVGSGCFAINVGSWKRPQIITNHKVVNSVVQMVGKERKEVFFAWESEGAVYVKHYDIGTCQWSFSEKRLSANDEKVLDFSLVTSAAGNAYVIWNSNQGIKVSQYKKELHSWVVCSPILGLGIYPSIACNDAGDAIAVWTVVDNGKFRIATSCYDKCNDVWGAETIVSPDRQHSDAAKVVIDQDGNAYLVWVALAHAPGCNKVQALVYDSHAKIWNQKAFTLSSPGENIDLDTLALVNSNEGEIMAMWTDVRETGGIRVTCFNQINKEWETVQTIAPVSYKPQLMFNSKGKGLLLWFNNEGLGSVHYTSQKKLWSDHKLITSGSIEEAYGDMNDNGQVLVVYKRDGNMLEYCYFDCNEWSKPKILNSCKSCYDQKVLLNNDGKAVVSWIVENKNNDNIQMVRNFDSVSSDPSPDIAAEILPPGNVRCKRKVRLRRNCCDIVNIIFWERSPSPSVATYNIYTDHLLQNKLFSIPAYKQPIFFHHGRVSGKNDTYYLTAASAEGKQSLPVEVRSGLVKNVI